jgi:hypothetical protein
MVKTEIKVPATEGADTISRPLPEIPELKESLAGAQGILGSLFARWRAPRAPGTQGRMARLPVEKAVEARLPANPEIDRVIGEMWTIYERIAAEQPELDRYDLYREVLLERLGGRHSAALRIMRKAEETFTRWPARELTFRDVVCEFLASPDSGLDEVSTLPAMGFVRRVHSQIPDEP